MHKNEQKFEPLLYKGYISTQKGGWAIALLGKLRIFQFVVELSSRVYYEIAIFVVFCLLYVFKTFNFSENIYFCEVVQWTTENLYLVVPGQFFLSGTTVISSPDSARLTKSSFLFDFSKFLGRTGPGLINHLGSILFPIEPGHLWWLKNRVRDTVRRADPLPPDFSQRLVILPT